MKARQPTQEEVAAGGMVVSENDHSIVEDAGVAFDPTTQHLDLSKEEKRRTTALMMAILQAYNNLIIKEAEYLKVASDLSRRDEGPRIQPATIDAMVDAAIKFDKFIGGTAQLSGGEVGRGSETES